MTDKIQNVTVLMAVYNDSKYISTSVKSILNQTFKDFEFLIINDGSTDDTEEIIRSFNDHRINYKKIPHKGLAGALNYGMKNSKYDWVARIDADDLNVDSRLQKQVDYLNEHDDADVLSSWSVYFNDENKILFTLKTPVSDKDIKGFLNLHNPVNHSSVIFNKNKILNEGGYDENFGEYEDFELWFRLRDKLRFRILPEFLVFTLLRENSMTGKGSRKNIYTLLKTNAESNLETSGGSKDKKFWMNILFWIEYFYGDKEQTRKYLAEDITIKKSIAFLNTFLPQKEFEKLIQLRLRQRIATKLGANKKISKELSDLLK